MEEATSQYQKILRHYRKRTTNQNLLGHLRILPGGSCPAQHVTEKQYPLCITEILCFSDGQGSALRPLQQ